MLKIVMFNKIFRRKFCIVIGNQCQCLSFVIHSSTIFSLQMSSWNNHNIVKLLQDREKNSKYAKYVKRYSQFTESLVKRLGLEHELEGHNGCVNCLQWTSDGRFVLGLNQKLKSCWRNSVFADIWLLGPTTQLSLYGTLFDTKSLKAYQLHILETSFL